MCRDKKAEKTLLLNLNSEKEQKFNNCNRIVTLDLENVKIAKNQQ